MEKKKETPPKRSSTTVHRTLDRAELFTPQGRRKRERRKKTPPGLPSREEKWREAGAREMPRRQETNK
jgi:hypothetical protein